MVAVQKLRWFLVQCALFRLSEENHLDLSDCYINTGIPPAGCQASFTDSTWIKFIQALYLPGGLEKGDINPGLGLIHGPFMETTAIHPPVCKIVSQRDSSRGVTACELPLKRAITMSSVCEVSANSSVASVLVLV